jgi:hypothetical protein
MKRRNRRTRQTGKKKEEKERKRKMRIKLKLEEKMYEKRKKINFKRCLRGTVNTALF